MRPDAPVHQIDALNVVYPSANTAALIVLALAGLGAITLTRALQSVARQLRHQRRIAHALVHARGEHVRVYDDINPTALTAGLLQPRIYVSNKTLELLAPKELAAVLAHEAHHRTRRDPLRLAIAQTLSDALFFLPPVKRLAHEHANQTEIDADNAAERAPLAKALLQLGNEADPQRVDSLLGKPPSRLPALLCGAAVTAGLAVALLVLVLAGRTAAGNATLALPGLSKQPCIVALALIPGVLATAAAVILKRR